MNCGITLVSESVLDYVTAMIFAGFLAERFFVVSIKNERRKSPMAKLYYAMVVGENFTVRTR